MLAIEDLSDADWEPRWDEARVAAVVDALAEIAASPHPPNTHSIRESLPGLFDRWRASRTIRSRSSRPGSAIERGSTGGYP